MSTCGFHKFKDIVIIINDIFNIDVSSDKTLISNLYKQIVNKGYEQSNIKKYEKINTHICEYLSELLQQFPVPLTFDESLDLSSVLKAMSVRFNYLCEDILTTLFSYIDLLHNLSKIKIVFFPYLKLSLSSEQIFELVKYAHTKNIVIVIFSFKFSSNNSEKPEIENAKQNQISVSITSNTRNIYADNSQTDSRNELDDIFYI
jgi:CRISPR type II-A-associated protein Csn2